MILVIWDLEEEPQGNIQHIAENDVTPEEVEEVLNDRHSRTVHSASSLATITFGWTAAGQLSCCSVGVGRRGAVDGLSGYCLSCPRNLELES